MKYLITPSLYNSYLYYAKGDFEKYGERSEEIQEDARLGFLNTLNKVKVEPTASMQKGIQFEDAIRNYAELGRYRSIENSLLDEDDINCALEFSKKVKGGTWQVVLSKKIDEFLIYGRSDVIIMDTIIDIKYTGSYEVGKFEQSIQHLIYMECTPINKFKYLIWDGKSDYEEDYVKQSNNCEILLSRIHEMVGFINSIPDFKEAFNKNWIAKEY